MRLIDRYLFVQLLWPMVLAIAALSGLAVLSESLSALDLLVDERQSVLIFIKVILLAMPQLIAMVMPVAVLLSAVVAMNRLHIEQEIVICFSTGMSRWRVVAPAFQLAGGVSLLCLVLTLWIQPLCYRALRETLENVRADLVATMIRPGHFSHPAPGFTVYAQSVDDDGVIHNLFVNRETTQGRDNTITAQEGRLEKRGGAPVLVMHNGANQQFSSTGVLNYLSFDDYVLDLKPLVSLDKPVEYKLSDRYLHELFFPDMRGAWERVNRDKMLAEGHSRIATPLYNLAFMALALAAVIGGAFSRLGYGARIAAVAATALVARIAGFAAQEAAGGEPALNAVQYLVPIAILAIAMAVILGARVRPRFAALEATA